MAWNPPELMRAHRSGPARKTSERQRTIILRCLCFMDRDRILQCARKPQMTIEGNKIYFTLDYSDATAQRRRLCYLWNRLLLRAFLLYPAVIKVTRGSIQHLFEEPKDTATFIDSKPKISMQKCCFPPSDMCFFEMD